MTYRCGHDPACLDALEHDRLAARETLWFENHRPRQRREAAAWQVEGIGLPGQLLALVTHKAAELGVEVADVYPIIRLRDRAVLGFHVSARGFYPHKRSRMKEDPQWQATPQNP